MILKINNILKDSARISGIWATAFKLISRPSNGNIIFNNPFNVSRRKIRKTNAEKYFNINMIKLSRYNTKGYIPSFRTLHNMNIYGSFNRAQFKINFVPIYSNENMKKAEYSYYIDTLFKGCYYKMNRRIPVGGYIEMGLTLQDISKFVEE